LDVELGIETKNGKSRLKQTSPLAPLLGKERGKFGCVYFLSLARRGENLVVFISSPWQEEGNPNLVRNPWQGEGKIWLCLFPLLGKESVAIKLIFNDYYLSSACRDNIQVPIVLF
jgi:hypothetical protein